MARFDVTGMEQTIKEMARLGESTGAVADAMLMAAAGAVRQEWQNAIRQFGHIDTGDMLSKVGYPRQPSTISDVRSIDVYPQGKDRRGVRNAEKAFIAHYGRVHQTGSGFVDVADRNSAAPVQAAMTAIWDHYIATGEVKTAAVADWHAG